MYPIRSILAATDLSPTCDAVLQAAAALADRSRAQLHVVYVAPPWGTQDDDECSAALDSQLRRALGDDVDVDAAVVFDRAFHGILVHAATVAADLIVLGPHRGSAAHARVNGTTAERVVRSSDVPCLVVRGPLPVPISRVGVLTNFTPKDRGAADLMAEWMPRFATPEASLHLVHVDEAAARTDDFGPQTDAETDAWLAREVDRMHERSDPDWEGGIVPVRLTRDGGGAVVERIQAWTEAQALNLLVFATNARTGFDRLWTGSRATALAVSVPCSVLIVPPSLWRRSSLPLARVAVAIDPEVGDGAPRRWIETRIAQAQRPLEMVTLDVSHARASDHGPADVLAAVQAANADLLAVYDDRTPGRLQVPVDVRLEGLLESTHVPVFVLRNVPDGAIKNVLVAVDTGELWYEKFGWARLLCERFGARVTIFHAIDLSLTSRVRRVPGGEFVSGASVWMKHDVEQTVVPAMRAWLWDRVRLAGLPADRVEVLVGLQDPWYAIPSLARRVDADVVIVAAHSAHAPGRASLSPVARAVLEGGSYSVLAVVDRIRREHAASDPSDAPTHAEVEDDDASVLPQQTG